MSALAAARTAGIPATRSLAVVGLGYVGLPTGLALEAAGFRVVGIDISERRLEDVRACSVDLLRRDLQRLDAALEGGNLTLTGDAGAVAAADAVLICVPTPVDGLHRPDLRFLRAACDAVVAHARRDQVIVLTSTTYVGSTRELLVAPLAARGLLPGEDVFVAFSPERIDPGNGDHVQESVPRVVGGATRACTEAAARVVARICTGVHRVSSPEAAELTKLYENTFRAVNIAFANEMAEATRRFGLDPEEVLDAAATKPYGFMPFRPGPGVGGHCIPCDPHYLLEGLRDRGATAPLVERAMTAIAARPGQIVDRVVAMLGRPAAEARVLVVGAAYKPGVRDVRESPAVAIIELLLGLGAEVAYHDPLVPAVELSAGLTLLSVPPRGLAGYDLAILACAHPGHDYGWLIGCSRLLDATRG